MRGPWARAILLGLLVIGLISRRETQAQIFADFTTSMGNFTCQLDQTNAPRAAANFIGLATGERAWLDLNTGRARTNAFYNGLTFHRVVTNFVIQAGSPKGDGSDGPGYALRDEFSPSLRFSSFGVLAMANSGTNSGGSQFFITVTNNASWLNDVHTIFGRVTTGSNVVYAISRVATDSSGKPQVNVVIQQVAIRRVGTAAQNFDINGQSLPVVTNVPVRIDPLTNQVSLTISNRLYAHNRLYTSTDFQSWNSAGLGIEIAAPSMNYWLTSAGDPQRFFRFARVQYAHSTFAPKDLLGRKLTLFFTAGYTGSITNNFNSAGTGTYTSSNYGPGTIDYYEWTQEPYRGKLFIFWSGAAPTDLVLNFNTASSGFFTGTTYPYYPIAGTFSL